MAKRNNKSFFKSPLFIAVAAFAALFVIFYVASPKPTIAPSQTTTSNPETANWKTYTNTKYGISIEYPSGWNLDSEAGTNDYLIFSITDPTQVGIRINLYKNFMGGYCEGSKITEKNVALNNGIRAKRIYCDGYEHGLSYTIDNDKYLSLPNGAGDEMNSTFEKILSSFRFTN